MNRSLLVVAMLWALSSTAWADEWEFTPVVGANDDPLGLGVLQSFDTPCTDGHSLALKSLPSGGGFLLHSPLHPCGVEGFAGMNGVPQGPSDSFSSFPFSIAVAQGQVFFRAIKTNGDLGIYSSGGVTIKSLVNTTTAAPGGGGLSYANFGDPRTDGTRLVFTGISGSIASIYSMAFDGTGLSRVVGVGDVLSTGAVVTAVGLPAVSGACVAFRGNVAQPGLPDKQCVLLHDGTGSKVLFSAGDPVPGVTGSATSVSQILTMWKSGHVVAQVSNGAMPAILSLSPAGAVEVIADTATVAPGVGQLFNSFGSGSFGMSGNGDRLFFVGGYPTGTGGFGRGIFLRESGVTSPVVLSGQSMPGGVAASFFMMDQATDGTAMCVFLAYLAGEAVTFVARRKSAPVPAFAPVPSAVSVGGSINLQASGGPTSAPALLAAVRVNALAVFVPLVVHPYDSVGKYQLPAVVPSVAGLAGNCISMRLYHAGPFGSMRQSNKAGLFIK